MEKKISVGISDMRMARQEGALITYALGSCVGISFYDSMIKLGALLHIMLPEQGRTRDSNVYKFADSGIRETLRKFYAYGGMKGRVTCKIAGGAKMFEMKGAGDLGNIGGRNAQMVKRVLAAEGICVAAEDVGGVSARTMQLDVTSGEVTISSVGKVKRVL